MKKILIFLTILAFAVSFFLLKLTLPVNDRFENNNKVLLPSPEPVVLAALDPRQTIENFFSLIGAGKIEEALSYLHPSIVSDEETRIRWDEQFSALREISLLGLAKLNTEEEIYRAQLNLKEINEGSSMVIPNFGWNKGENVRWITLEKENDSWKISQIATGP